MIITINQAQIEEAITAFVHSRLVVQEGMTLEIDLRATRGEGGMTAVIEILPAAEATNDESPAVEAAPVVAQVAKVSAAKATPVKTTAAAATPVTDTPAAEVIAEAEAEAAPEPAAEVVEAAPKKSIFASMKQPTGRVGDNEAALAVSEA